MQTCANQHKAKPRVAISWASRQAFPRRSMGTRKSILQKAFTGELTKENKGVAA